jgi:hypothetical protein
MAQVNGLPSRRSFLRNAAIMTLAAPLARTLAQTAPRTPIRRVVTMYHPSALNWADFSSRTSDTNFTLGRILQPLQSIKDKLLVVDSPNRLPGITENGALPLNNMHFQGVGAAFTGTALTNTGGGCFGPPKGVSLDWYLSSKLHTPTQRALQFGVNSTYQACPWVEGITHRGGGVVLPSENSPLTMFDRLFSAGMTGGGADAGVRAAEIRARRKSLLDASLPDFNRLGTMCGAEGKAKIDADLASFRQLEVQVMAEMTPMPQGPGLNRPAFMLNADDTAKHVELAQRQFDILAAAMRADLCRFASFQFLTVQSNARMLWMPMNWPARQKLYHADLTHITQGSGFGMATNMQYLSDVITVWAQQIAYFVNLLNTANEIDGSGKKVFDNTTIVWASELESVEHQWRRNPYVLIGNLGGTLRTGQHINTMRSNNDLLHSVAVAAGGSQPNEKFGFAGACTGVIPSVMT